MLARHRKAGNLGTNNQLKSAYLTIHVGYAGKQVDEPAVNSRLSGVNDVEYAEAGLVFLQHLSVVLLLVLMCQAIQYHKYRPLWTSGARSTKVKTNVRGTPY